MVLQIDIKRAVCLNRPNRAERVRPGPDQRGFPGLLKHGASAKQSDRGRRQDNLERDLFVHAGDAVHKPRLFQAKKNYSSLLTLTAV